jgi:predicted nucleic acid-binding protein
MSIFKVLVTVLPLEDKSIELALAADFTDFEDGLQYFTAINYGADAIVTRNKKDFKNSFIPVMTAGEFLEK